MPPAFHETANTVTIFGGTGDLAQRKLLPAIRRRTPEEATRATVLAQYRGYLE